MNIPLLPVALTLLFLFTTLLGRRQGAPVMHGGPLSNSSQIPNQNSFKLGVYNIHRGRGTDGQKDLQRIAGVIKDVDVVGLCECEGASILGKPNQCEQLGALLDTATLFGPTQKRFGRYDRGNGLLSRLSVSRWYQEPLVDSTGTHPRCILRADLVTEAGEIAFFVTHLARRIDQREQLKTVIDRFQQYDRAILVGDFNMVKESRPLAEFLEQRGCCDAIATGRGDYAKRIDWIFTRGVEIIDRGYHPKGPSDHPFYWIEVKV